MHQQSPSGTAPRRWRGRAKLAAGTLALTMGALGAGLTATALPAYADVLSSYYTIGTPSGSVGTVTATPATVAASASNSFTVTFTAAAALAGSSNASVTVTSSTPLSSVPTAVALIGGNCIQSGTAGNGGAGIATTGQVTIYLLASCSISAGTGVAVSFTANAPATTGTFHFTVSTSSNVTAATSNTITVGTSGATLSAASHNFGVNTSYTVSNVSVAGLTTSQTVVTLSVVPAGTISLPNGAASYTVTYTPPGGAAGGDAVTGFTFTSSSMVSLTLATPVSNGGTLNITFNASNPSAAATAYMTVQPATGTAQATNSITFGNSVTAVTVTPSSALATATTTYTISFKTSSTLNAGGDIFLTESTGPTNFSTVTGVALNDTTQSRTSVVTGAALASGSATLPTSFTINAGDSIVLTLVNVTNPAAQTISDFMVYTSSDNVPAAAAAYTIGANGSPGVVVTPNPNTVGSIATYTIANARASAAMTGGSSTIQFQAPAGTVFPNSPGDYSVTDSTTASGTGTVTAGLVGGGTNNVTFTVPNSINANDALTFTVLGVINPSAASSTYQVNLVGNVTGPTPVAPFPQANVTYPNGAIISFSGTHYVFAGGRAFGISSTSQLTALQKVNKAQILNAASGATPPTSVAPRVGTLMFTRPIDGVSTIYVVGTDGELHGFATPKQFGDGGYNGALVVTVTNLGGLKIGATEGALGASGNALATSADGAIVLAGSDYYTFAGGRAFNIQNGTQLSTIKKTNKATIIKGTVTSAQKSASVAAGVLLTVAGPVYVTYQGEAWPFKSMNQLHSTGYGGTAAVPVPTTGGLTIVNY
jgi:hypothetical protein